MCSDSDVVVDLPEVNALFDCGKSDLYLDCCFPFLGSYFFIVAVHLLIRLIFIISDNCDSRVDRQL